MYIGDDIPQLHELIRHIVPVYASVWKDLGLELKIPDYALNTIAMDHAYHPSSSTECCKVMLQKWIRMSSRPTWATLQEALEHLPDPQHDDCKSKLHVFIVFAYTVGLKLFKNYQNALNTYPTSSSEI